MAVGALSFAEVLRDEYAYLHGAEPRVGVEIESKHLRELPRLVLRIKAAPRAQPNASMSRESLLKLYCDFSGCEGDLQRECDVVTKAFQRLVELEQLKIVSSNRKSRERITLYEALLRNPDPDKVRTARLRDPHVLRKLLRIPHARRILFHDPDTCKTIGATQALRDAVAADAAALRLLDDSQKSPGGRQTLITYPALLATIADDGELACVLASDPSLRTRLIELFAPEKPATRWARFKAFFVRPKPEPRTDLRLLAGDAEALKKQLGLPKHKRRAVDWRAERTLFNSIVLETAFPDCFTDSYDVRSLNTAFHERDMAALCLSGGGIRSATFNLGVLQGLADHGLLTRFHYLSTVSGGGYIGSWLSSWIRRHNEGICGVAADLKAPPADPEEPELRPIQHLREYSSYLAPRSASLSSDTWTLIATYLRNLLLNWTMLLPALAAVLAAPRAIESLAYMARPAWSETACRIAAVLASLAIVGLGLLRPKHDRKSGRAPTAVDIRKQRWRASVWMYPLVVAALVFSVYWASLAEPPERLHFAWLLMGTCAGTSAAYTGWQLLSQTCGGVWARIVAAVKLLREGQRLRQTLGEILSAAAAGFVAGFLLRFAFVAAIDMPKLRTLDEVLYFEQFVCLAVPLFLLVFFVASTLHVGWTTLRTNDHDREWWARSGALMLLAAFVWMAGAAIALIVPVALALSPSIVASAGGVSGAVSWLLARSAKLRSREERETRSVAVLRAVVHLAAAMAVALILAALSLATTWLLWKLVKPGPVGVPSIARLTATQLALRHLAVLHQTGWMTVSVFAAVSLLVAVMTSLLLEVNVYSLHGMYRNRLIRAYLGASRWFRRPDPFTGFDPQDDVHMYELRADALWSSSFIDFDRFVTKLLAMPSLYKQLSDSVQDRLVAFRAAVPQAPSKDEMRSELTHELNQLMARNDLVHGVPAPPCLTLFAQNRRYLDHAFAGLVVPAPVEAPPPATQPEAPARTDVNVEMRCYDLLAPLAAAAPAERRRPPLHIVNTALNLVGGDNLAWQERKADSFTISPLHAGNRRLGYRDSYQYGGRISLGSALAISGAALSPNMGQNSSPALTFLMTLFNARLGSWLGNPSEETYRKAGPSSTLHSLIAELTGNTNDTSDYVFLSDGGHFDNLGLYEMVRRRCRFIVVSDATADGKYAFGDLGNAVRKIRVDMGIPITLRTRYLPPGDNERIGRYCAVGLIEYGNVDTVTDERRYGHLLYIKPAVRDDCPPDVRNYKNECQTFPHETTVDQFFCESQFESYRALGRHMIGRISNDVLGTPAAQARAVADFMIWAHDHVRQAPDMPTEVRLVT